MKKTIQNKVAGINKKTEGVIEQVQHNWERESRLSMIQMLIPLGLEAVASALNQEVQELAGEKYSRGGEIKRWGANPGSVFIGEQKIAINVPRVRNVETDKEVTLASYSRLQEPAVIDDIVLSRVINGISNRNYEKAAVQIPETFGIKKTSVCRKFIRASAKKLREFKERDLSKYDIVAIFIDGKFFGSNEVVIALGVTIHGEKIVLGFVETSTENHKVCKDFLNSLKERGLNTENEVLFIIDGSKGLYKGVTEVMGEGTNIQRCQWHKRENVVKYLSKELQGVYRQKMQAAYEQPTYEKAKRKLTFIRKELQLINESAVASLDEGLEETLTLHKLGVFDKIGESFKTTNCLENVNKQLDKYTHRVTRWQNSSQRQRWVATAIVEIEPNFRKVRGYKYLELLRTAMKVMAAPKTKNQENAA